MRANRVIAFEDLVAWQLSMRLSGVIYEITERGKAAEDYRFQNQIRDAAKAPAPLIAEGFRRFTPGEFVHDLRMAAGEIAEVQTHLESARGQKYFPAEADTRASNLAKRASVATIRPLKSKLPLLKNARRDGRKRAWRTHGAQCTHCTRRTQRSTVAA